MRARVLVALTAALAGRLPGAGHGRTGTAGRRASGPLRWPASSVVTRPFDPPPGPYAAGHRGVDLGGVPGSPVLAAGAGVVVFAGMVAGRPVVSIDHADGLRTTYEPVDPSVAAGQVVARGSPIGTLAGRPRRVPARGLPALGAAPGRDLPRPDGPAPPARGPTAAHGRAGGRALACRMLEPAAPRWPDVRPGRGHYESYYLRAVDPARPRGVWIRYTVHAAPGGRPSGQLWFTFFDRDAPRPRAVRVDVDEPTTGDGTWIRLGEACFGPSGIAGAAGAASWSLRWRSSEPALAHLPRDWMYRARLPRTKLLSLSPAAVFDGTVSIDGETVDLAGWPGMVGHNWGEQHADSWIWLHGLGFEGRGADTWLDVAVGRIALGPVTTPWVANGAREPGRRAARPRRARAAGDRGRRGRPLRAAAARQARDGGRDGGSAPAEAFVEWDYAEPRRVDAPRRQLLGRRQRVHVERTGAEPMTLSGPHRAAYELGRH